MRSKNFFIGSVVKVLQTEYEQYTGAVPLHFPGAKEMKLFRWIARLSAVWKNFNPKSITMDAIS